VSHATVFAEKMNAPHDSPPDTATVLVVDDEPNLRRVLGAVLGREGVNVIVAESGREAIKKAKALPRLDLLVTDYLMPDLNGLEVIASVRRVHPHVASLVISGHGTVKSAVEAMRLGVFDYITKPFDVEKVLETVNRALHAPTVALPPVAPAAPPGGVTAPPNEMSGTQTATPTETAHYGMLGADPATRRVREELLRAAKARATVLLLGESGTGKEVAARLLHEASPRSRGSFVAVSCAALPETLLESELFGHEKGAFTGSQGAKPGRFEMADGGTLFLDEIGDIPHVTQVKLLRALQEREVSRIGGTKNIKVDVRVVGATNRDLWQAVQDGTFRLDLYYRLHVIPVVLPPLRDRLSDVGLLAEHFLGKLSRENGRTFPEGISPQTLQVLKAHTWPGNLRELQNVIEYAVVMAPASATRIEAEFLPRLHSVLPGHTPVPTNVSTAA
jgi:DNA-binding NtrC family response regulator